MAVVEKKLSLDSLRIGMVLAQDVIDPKTGEVVAEKNKALDQDTLSKLKIFYIENEDEAPVEPDPAKEDEEILAGSIPYLPENQRQSYINFKNAYAKSYDKIQEYMSSIQSGEMPELSELNKITDDIMRTVRHKSDVFAYLNYLKSRGDFLYDHSVCVSLVCRVFAEWLKFSHEETETLVSVGLLHDIGMVKISETIINKEEKLSDEEFVKVTMHPIYGYNMLKNFDIPDDVKFAVLQHHERIDATGYPNHLNGGQINRYAKVIAILDVFGAMIYDRPYREKFAPFSVIKTFEREYLGKLDTEYLMIFLQNIAYNYIERSVRLSNGKVANVVFINKAQCSAPIVRLEDGEYVDLLFDKSIHIEEVL